VCLTVAHVDGLVMARSAFHFSVNYRSAMLFGNARMSEDADEKKAALKEFVNRMASGRWDDLRAVTRKELKATTVLWMEIDEGSAKVAPARRSTTRTTTRLPIWRAWCRSGWCGQAGVDPRSIEHQRSDALNDLRTWDWKKR
jgi:hypothetical protein